MYARMFVCMYVWIFIISQYMYIYICMCTYVCGLAWICSQLTIKIELCVYAWIYVCIYACMYVCRCMYVGVHVYIHTCIHICTYSCIHIHKYINMHHIKSNPQRTGWQRPTECLEMHVIFRKRATSSRSLLWKMTYTDMAF